MSEASDCKYWQPAPGKVVVDAGFGPGTWTLDALERGARVYAFDPKPYACQLLMEQIAANGYSRATVVPFGLWSRKCKLPFGVNSFRAGFDNVFAGDEAWVTSLDEYFMSPSNGSLYRYCPVDTINMDAEGAELEIVNGARVLIRSFLPTLIVEVHEMYGVNKGELTAEIKRLGPYEVFEDGFLIARAGK